MEDAEVMLSVLDPNTRLHGALAEAIDEASGNEFVHWVRVSVYGSEYDIIDNLRNAIENGTLDKG
jgi:hypothetical protein